VVGWLGGILGWLVGQLHLPAAALVNSSWQSSQRWQRSRRQLATV